MEDHELERIATHPRLSKEEEIALAERIRAGDRAALQHLVACNIQLVIHLVRRMAKPHMPFEDCVDEGVLGLIRAAELYDPAKFQTRFSTLAAWHIRRYVFKARFDQQGPLRRPIYLEQIRRDSAAGTPPTEQQQAYLLDASRASGLAVSLEGDLRDDRQDLSAVFLQEELRESLELLLSKLDQRSAEFIRRYYGLSPFEPQLMRAIADDFGMTRSRVHQIITAARKKLRELARVVD